MPITTICFDADDTLWQNETLFHEAHETFCTLLSAYAPKNELMEELVLAEGRNIPLYGFGIKGFVLSMLEVAGKVFVHQVPSAIMNELIGLGQEMLVQPVELLPNVEETLNYLQAHYRLCIITKGDLLDQKRKLDHSGLCNFFDQIEIVTEKTPKVYQELFARHRINSDEAIMIGNSIKSDILPVLILGGWAMHIPYHLTWSHEKADPPLDHPRFLVGDNIAAVPDVVLGLE